eukprot:COSAG01_NODE_8441_length_2783_cov_1.202607_5_plen_67_part_01
MMPITMVTHRPSLQQLHRRVGSRIELSQRGDIHSAQPAWRPIITTSVCWGGDRITGASPRQRAEPHT